MPRTTVRFLKTGKTKISSIPIPPLMPSEVPSIKFSNSCKSAFIRSRYWAVLFKLAEKLPMLFSFLSVKYFTASGVTNSGSPI